MRKNRAFTLIELLVVIAIIAILAAIVLVNLNSAREKAQDTAIKAELSEIRSAAEMYYDNNDNSYLDVCTSTEEENQVPSLIGDIDATVDCDDSADEWAAGATLPGGDDWCVDSSGFSGEATKEADDTSCQ